MILCLALLTFLPELAFGSIISSLTSVFFPDSVCATLAGSVSSRPMCIILVRFNSLGVFRCFVKLISISSSFLLLLGDPDYLEAISHWASSSTEPSACAVVPGTAADVGIIVSVPIAISESEQMLTTHIRFNYWVIPARPLQ